MNKKAHSIAIGLMSLAALCCQAQFPIARSTTLPNHIINGDIRDFGIQNPDTILALDCNEFFTDPKSSLFYADFRKSMDMDFEAQVNTNLTEQVFVCKEGTRYNEAAGIMVGFDPTVERIFAEITDSKGKQHRIWAGDKALPEEWIKVKIKGISDEDFSNSKLTLSVSADGKKWDDATIEYSGPVMPAMASCWVIGRGYPGGFPNSLQVRKGAIRNFSVSGTGRERCAGENPIFTDRLTADPACTVVGDRIYAFVGEDCAAPGGWFTMPHWVAYSSKDMKNWECHGVVLKASDFPYANPNGAWAGQVVERDGKFYYYVTLDDMRNGRHAIDVAVADNPLGPYLPARLDRDPLITDDMTPDSHRWNADIDPTVMIDDDGQAWIVWGNGDFYLSRLKDNMIELEGEVMHMGVRNVSEGPWLFKRNGKYYNVYAADAPGVQPEQLAYSMADNITGPWTYGGLVTGPAKFGFTIHPSVNEFNGKWYLFYHDGSYIHDGAPGGDCRRQVCVEPLYFDEEGKILPIELTEIGVTK
ncbi:MAG: family 43 glycosylhydrolase [Muribaculaceae bacterium]|nr:family 43 glycosylhydrolase [Muribaculaceae bacterium]